MMETTYYIKLTLHFVPDLTKGYNTKLEHPMYKTSAAVYG